MEITGKRDLPKRINGLTELAYNLWWSWHEEARDLFKYLDRPLWKAKGHNAVKLMQEVAPYKLVAAAQNTVFLKKYDSVMRDFRNDMQGDDTWLAVQYPHFLNSGVAYFSLEYAIHNSLPIYAGGLGVLAGDYCKEASDLGFNMFGVGFMYPQGYFQQYISADGWQEEAFEQLNFDESPISPVYDDNGERMIIEVPLNSATVHVGLWQLNVGRVKLYLLDTNIPENSPPQCDLSARLYVGERETRLQQEIILGIGGVRALRKLGIDIEIWHANEGHTAFMMLERVRELVEFGLDFDKAADMVRQTSIFTTHTPVAAGHDVFDIGLIEKYFNNYWNALGLDKDRFLQLGVVEPDHNNFNMTALALRMANLRNGVSQLHGRVCRQMWNSLWPDTAEDEVPIGSITNGIHVPTWVSPKMANLYKQYLGDDWLIKHDDPALWEHVLDIPNEEIWEARRWLKYKLIRAIKDRIRIRWREDSIEPIQALAMGALIDAEVLTIGFARRFTEYKRSALILNDFERLKRILQNELLPVQIVFAGKAHPNDIQGKQFIQDIYNVAKNPELGGRIAFIENYDMHMARYLIHGVDVWLNLPRPLQEASGTSGQKAALNGVPHLSVLDGWWYEGYNGSNGWSIYNETESPYSPMQDKADAEQLYELLEEKIIPLYYERDIYGIPHSWIRVIKESIRSNAPLFSTRRMTKEYGEYMYLQAAKANVSLQIPSLSTMPNTSGTQKPRASIQTTRQGKDED